MKPGDLVKYVNHKNQYTIVKVIKTEGGWQDKAFTGKIIESTVEGNTVGIEHNMFDKSVYKIIDDQIDVEELLNKLDKLTFKH